MSWTEEDRSFKKSVNKRLTDSAGKYYFNEIGDLTQNVHIGELWIDPIPVQPSGSFESIQLYTDFILTQDNTVLNAATWYAYDTINNIRLKDWIPDKYDNVDLSNYQIILKTNGGTVIPLGADGYDYLFDYETGILTFQTPPPSSYYSGGGLKLTGYRYIGRKGFDNNILKSPCRLATTNATINGNWTWTNTNSGTITITSTTNLVIDGVSVNSKINPSNSPSFNLIADRILIKDYISPNDFQNGIYNVTQDGSTSGTWILTRSNDYNTSAQIYPDAVFFVQSGTIAANTIWCMSNRSFTTLNATDSTGEINYTQGLGSPAGTPNYLAKFASDGNTVIPSILEEVNSDYVYVHGSILSPYKSFIIDHPTKVNNFLIYGCLEGPEHGVYHRGQSEGIGEVRIQLPEYWSKLTKEYSISITPYGNYILFINHKDDEGFTVKIGGPFWNKRKIIKFDYHVIGLRASIEYEIRKDLFRTNNLQITYPK